jgi:hypothetical protein
LACGGEGGAITKRTGGAVAEDAEAVSKGKVGDELTLLERTV